MALYFFGSIEQGQPQQRSIYRASDKNIMHIPSNIQCTLTYQVTYLCADVVSIVPYWLNLALSFVSGIASILWFLSLSTVNRTQVRTVHVYLMLVCFGVFFHQMVSMVYKLSCPWQNSKERLSYEEVLAYSKFFTDLLFLLLLLFLTNGVYVCVEQAKLILYVSCAITLVSTPSLLSIQMEDYNWFHIVIFCNITTSLVYSDNTACVCIDMWTGAFCKDIEEVDSLLRGNEYRIRDTETNQKEDVNNANCNWLHNRIYRRPTIPALDSTGNQQYMAHRNH
eukprot:TRINITY_DN752_c18_g1_i1.p2 TRINITY_DN752_c18_g1~~TRINITY_DN752_c18_g1_i1.p2  ORF type:complete len:280 (-),score=-11.40 TRINITY_DN752_c18_g1_i1:1065-1904(-)